VSQFLDVLRFEIAFRRRHPPVWIFTGVCLLLSFLSMAITDGMSLFGGVGTIAINAPSVLLRMMVVFCILFGFVITTAFVAPAVNRDADYGIQGLFFATPLGKTPYLLGRFCGSLLAAWLMISGLALGALIASLMPWHDPARVVELSLTPYIYTLGVFLYPNVLLIGAIAFAVATLTRRNMFAYVALLGLLVVYVVSGNYVSDLDNDFIAAISDPFGMRAYGYATRYWTPAELNTVAAPFTREIVINRLLWTGAGLAILATSVWRYRMGLAHGRGKARKAEPDASDREAELAPLPKVTAYDDLRAQLSALGFQTRLEIRSLVRSAPFLVIALFGVGNIVGGAFGMIRQGGTTTLPVTHLMLTVIEGGMSLFILIVLVFYAGELIHRERKHSMDQLYDTLPIPNWVPMVAKLAAMIVAIAVLLLVAMSTTVVFQLAKGYSRIELGLYLRDIGLMQIQVWLVLSVAAVVAQVFVNHKFIGYGIMVLLFVAQAALPALDFEHNLYNFPSFPGVTYSDMNGYGHFIAGQVAFSVYWGAAAVLLVLLAELAWVRGTDNPLRRRLQLARARLDKRRSAAIIAAVLVWLGAGGYIYYNTNVLNLYRPSDEQEALQARYEREYKQYEALPHPRISAVEVEVEVYPHERRVEVRGTLELVNKTDQAIEEIHVPSFDPEIEVVALDIPGAELASYDEELGYRIFSLGQAMAPGERWTVTYHYRKHLRGFGNQANDNAIVANGTFFNSFTYMPHFGYAERLELTDPNTRKEQDLPPRPRMAKIDDEAERLNNYLTDDADWVSFAATVSTTPEQIAVAPGYLKKEWSEGGRRYFRYEMDAPILNFWSVLSAEYSVARDEWVPEGGGEPVAIEIFYHHVHDYNVDKMIEAIKNSLDYFTVNFSPYQHRQVRVLEFPQYASFAQSFPNTIPYSESIGFIADANKAEDIDYVYYVTSHEVAHQWWAHQVIGANVQGATLMSESLAQYSALMVMQQRYGPDKMPKFLRYELDRYLNARSGERIEEMPLLLVENQPYIHYRKASVIFYALSEYIGEDALNAALSDYVDEVGFQQPPYTISTELYAHLEQATPAKYRGMLADMFERITLFDNRATEATVVERDDGKFEVTLTVQVKKFYADGAGVETEVETLDDWIEVGAYREAGAEGEADTPIDLELRHFDGSETELTIVVDEKPDKVGIDPRNLLIDRAPRDNKTKVSE